METPYSSSRQHSTERVGDVTPRILVVDDNESIHNDFERVLTGVTSEGSASLDEMEASLFGEVKHTVESKLAFRLDFASQGEHAIPYIESSLKTNDRYAVAFVDMRMPPGWNGMETSKQIMSVDPMVNIVICTAYSDFSWQEVIATVGSSERLHLLRKPFTPDHVRKVADVLSTKWARQLRGSKSK